MAEQQLRVRLLALTQGFNQNMAAAQSRLTAFGTKAKQVGASLRSIQLPLALASGAAVKMAVDFDKSMTQIKSLVGVAGAEVDAMGERAKRMAADTGQSANAAAEALFFITSAGLRGEEAMQVLEASLKAAAVGLGETKTVADLATSAMNAYGSDVLSATDATDVMVSAVREGKLEADELAQSMGRVLPVASAMGVRFDEVGAAFAALSRTGTNAAEAATQVRGILTSLLKPTTDAQTALAEMGLSTQGLRQEIKEKGLLSALETLKTNFDGNDEAAQRVFGNVRALSGIMDLLGANVQTTRDIFDSMTQSAGATEKAFAATSESASFQLTKALNEARVAFTEMGAVILTEVLPLIKNLSKFITDLFKAFSNLDDGTQKFIITVGGIVLVAPTVISAIGGISAAVATLSGSLAALTGAKGLVLLKTLLTGLTSPFAIAVAAVGTAIFAFDKLTDSIAPNVDLIEKLRIGLLGLQNPAAALAQLMGAEIEAKSRKGLITGTRNAMNELRNMKVNQIGGDILPFGRTDEVVATLPKVEKAVGAVTQGISTLSTTIKGANIPSDFKKLGDSANFVLVSFQSVAQSIGQSLMAAVMNGGNAMAALGKVLLGAIGDILIQMGTAAIAASKLAKTFAIPIVGAAAGIAAVALGTMIKGMSSKIQGDGFAKFANGGIVSAPTLGLMGEYMGARSNPEVIAPLDRLQSLMGMRSQNVNVTGQFRLDGQDLVVAVERASNQRSNFIG
jgi:TP901 family phage tail tape measure protein